MSLKSFNEKNSEMELEYTESIRGGVFNLDMVLIGNFHISYETDDDSKLTEEHLRELLNDKDILNDVGKQILSQASHIIAFITDKFAGSPFIVAPFLRSTQDTENENEDEKEK